MQWVAAWNSSKQSDILHEIKRRRRYVNSADFNFVCSSKIVLEFDCNSAFAPYGHGGSFDAFDVSLCGKELVEQFDVVNDNSIGTCVQDIGHTIGVGDEAIRMSWNRLDEE